MAEEDKRHQSGAHKEGHHDTERQRDPAMVAHFDIAEFYPDPIAEDRGKSEKAKKDGKREEGSHLGVILNLPNCLAKMRGVLSTSGCKNCDNSGKYSMEDIAVIPISGEEDLGAAFAIRKSVFVDEQNVELRLEFDGLDRDAKHLVATLDDKPVGTLRLRQIDNQTGKIERVAVLLEARGRAIGKALLKAALSQLKADGATSANLHAQTHALEFYAGLGFVAYGDVFDEDGLPHRAMLRDL